MTIESKEQSRLWHAFLALEIAAFSPFEIRVPLNGAQMGHTQNLHDIAGRPAEPAGRRLSTGLQNLAQPVRESEPAALSWTSRRSEAN